MYTEFPCLKIFFLHNFQKWDCLCTLAHTFDIGLFLLMMCNGVLVHKYNWCQCTYIQLVSVYKCNVVSVYICTNGVSVNMYSCVSVQMYSDVSKPM